MGLSYVWDVFYKNNKYTEKYNNKNKISQSWIQCTIGLKMPQLDTFPRNDRRWEHNYYIQRISAQTFPLALPCLPQVRGRAFYWVRRILDSKKENIGKSLHRKVCTTATLSFPKEPTKVVEKWTFPISQNLKHSFCTTMQLIQNAIEQHRLVPVS